MELSKKGWKNTKKECLNKNSSLDHHSNIVCGRFIHKDVHFEFSNQNGYYDFHNDILYWFHRYEMIGFWKDFIVEYSSEFLHYFPNVEPPNNSVIKYEKNPKHNLLLSFKSLEK
jgi:hypothetical protein